MRRQVFLLIVLIALSGCVIADSMKKERKQMSMANRLIKKETVGRCTQQIIYSEDVKEYADLVEEIIKPLSPNIQNNGESLGIVKRPLHAILVLNENDYNMLDKIRDKSNEQSVVLTIQDYEKLPGLDSEGIKLLLLTKPRVPLDTTLGYWTLPLPSNIVFKNFELIRGESYIVIYPAIIEKLAENIKERINESIENIKISMLRITLMHELGHHYSLSNVSNNSRNIYDLNLRECLAQYFAYQLLAPQERRIMAEKAINQDVPYKLYLLFRYFKDTSNIMKILVDETDYIKALKVFAELMGGRLKMGSGTFVVGKADLLFDYSNGGGNILAGEIDMLFPYKGRVIASKIHTLAGRYHKDTLIIANAIDDYPDYSSLPDNIRLIKREEYDLAKIIDKYKITGLQGKELVDAVLKEIGIEQK